MVCCSALDLKQLLLALRTPAVSAQAPVTMQYAMARYDDRDRVGRDGSRHGTYRPRPADRPRHVAIGARRPVGDAAEFLPHPPLERRRLQVDGQVEARQFAPQMAQDAFDPLAEPGLAARLAFDFGVGILGAQRALEHRG